MSWSDKGQKPAPCIFLRFIIKYGNSPSCLVRECKTEISHIFILMRIWEETKGNTLPEHAQKTITYRRQSAE